MSAADRSLGILSQLQLAESHRQRIEQQQPADERIAFTDDKFQDFVLLNRTYNSRQHSENASLGARRNQTWRRRFGIQAAVARTVRISKNAGLPFEAENRTVDVGLAEEHASVVNEIARREVVGAVHHDVVVSEDVERVFAREHRLKSVDLNVGIQAAQPLGCRLDFWTAYVVCAEKNLALKVGEVDFIEINEPDSANARRREILS